MFVDEAFQQVQPTIFQMFDGCEDLTGMQAGRLAHVAEKAISAELLKMAADPSYFAEFPACWCAGAKDNGTPNCSLPADHENACAVAN